MAHQDPAATAGPATSTRRRIRPHQVTVGEVVQETRDAVTLSFVTREPVEYLAGQFLTIDPQQFEDLEDFVAYFEEVKGKREPPRAYSMCSSPLEAALSVTVKEERYARGATRYPPLLSPHLARRLAPGRAVEVVGFTGGYVLPSDVEERTGQILHVVAGSGSVPNYSILKYSLAVHPRLRHTFVYSNRTWDDIIFRDALGALEARHPERLRVIHSLTREEAPERYGPGVRRGRVGAALLRELVPDPAACLVYVCGPAVGPHERVAARERGEAPTPRFMEGVLAALAEIGVPRERIKTEAYG